MKIVNNPYNDKGRGTTITLSVKINATQYATYICSDYKFGIGSKSNDFDNFLGCTAILATAQPLEIVLVWYSGLPKVIFLAVAKAEGEGRKTSALEVEAEGEAEGLVFCI